jgi:hypothetical protein
MAGSASPIKPPSKEITTWRPSAEPYVMPDPDYVADLEQNDGQLRKRMAQRMRGRRVNRPKEPT